MKILLTGGGTAGSVTPLIAVAHEIKTLHPKTKFLLVGTKHGPERILAQKYKLDFMPIPVGKWRRYLSWQNLLSPFLTFAGFIQSFKLLREFKPDCIVGAGSFVQVPVIWAGKILNIPALIHQQDVLPGLANRLCQIPAKLITVSFEQSLKQFSQGSGLFHKNQPSKVIFTGNPFLENLKNTKRETGLKYFGLKTDMPTLLVLGGGTGSAFLNQLVIKTLDRLTKTFQIIHSTGENKSILPPQRLRGYVQYPIITNMAAAYAAADIVLSRAGLGTITELSNLEKVSIIVPLPNSHQELNAALLFRQRAALVIPQKELKPEILVELLRHLLFAPKIQKELMHNINRLMPKDSALKLAQLVIDLAEARQTA